MTIATMREVYLALQSGLSIPVSRSWPQTPPALPGCTFHLNAWERQSDGAAQVSFRVFLRTEQNEEADSHTQSAITAMLTLGYVLYQAQDGVEEQTGVFLRTLTFLGTQAAPLKPPDASPDFHVAVFGAGQWHHLPEPASFLLIPAKRGLITPQGPGFDAPLLPHFAVTRASPAQVLIKAPWQTGLLATDHLRDAFQSGNEVNLRLSYRLPESPQTFLGVLVAFHASILGINMKLALRNL